MTTTAESGYLGRAFAGLALIAAATACDSGDTGRGPGAPTQGEEAALEDAAEMLEAREPVETEPEADPDGADAEQVAPTRTGS
ncbi:hypothetical protein [Aurantiacibacter hainanensis]|uniref:hypothetical protein n=1 Tax=Aurantiacibacter hainanensis TaxID=3076114 RepID=UPI0030C6869A